MRAKKKDRNMDTGISEGDVELELWHGAVRCSCCRPDWGGGRDLPDPWGLKPEGAGGTNGLVLASGPGAAGNCGSPAA